jgi:hypothetical protein
VLQKIKELGYRSHRKDDFVKAVLPEIPKLFKKNVPPGQEERVIGSLVLSNFPFCKCKGSTLMISPSSISLLCKHYTYTVIPHIIRPDGKTIVICSDPGITNMLSNVILPPLSFVYVFKDTDKEGEEEESIYKR